MVLRCSLLGHDFGEPEVERERDNRGSEVIVTVQEYETCARCGKQNVLSENTEVTSVPRGGDVEAPADADPADAADEPAAADALDDEPTAVDDTGAVDDPDPADAQADEEPAAGDAEIIDAGAELSEADGSADDVSVDESRGDVAADAGEQVTEADVGAEPTGDGEAPENVGDHPTDEDGEPITDDAEILDEGSEVDRDRQHGEWPDADDTETSVSADDPAGWPDEGGAAQSEADAEAEPADAEARAGGGDTVLVDADAEVDAADPEGAADQSPTSGIERAGSAPDPSGAAPDGVLTEFFCPSCGYVAPGDRGSLRPGDICPECKKGYLGERER